MVLSVLLVMIALLYVWQMRSFYERRRYERNDFSRRARAPKVPKRERQTIGYAIERLQGLSDVKDVRKYVTGWGTGSSLDATYQAGSILSTCTEIEGLASCHSLSQWFYHDRDARGREARRLVEPVMEHFLVRQDERYVSFLFQEGWRHSGTLYCNDSGTRILFPLAVNELNPDWLGESEQAGIRVMLLSLLEKTYVRQNGDGPWLFRDEPNGHRPTVFATFAALGMLSKIGQDGLEGIDLGNTSRSLLGEPYRVDGKDGFGFKDAPNERLSVCATFFALRALGWAAQLQGGPSAATLVRLLQERRDRLLDSVLYWRSDIEGWAGSRREESSRMSLRDVRYSLQILRCLLEWKVLEPEGILSEGLHPAGILKMVLGHCRSGGYAAESGTTPSVLATRWAVNIVKLLEIFRLNGVFAGTYEYRAARDKVLQGLGEVRRFTGACQDRATGGYFMFPRREYRSHIGTS